MRIQSFSHFYVNSNPIYLSNGRVRINDVERLRSIVIVTNTNIVRDRAMQVEAESHALIPISYAY